MIRAQLSAIRREEAGYSLVELVVVMAVLGVVLAGLSTIFVSGSSAEAQLNHRFKAQQDSRAALDRIRSDIHCASKAQVSPINTYTALRLNVTSCNAGVVKYDYWCVISSSTVPVRYQLWRAFSAGLPTTATCTSTDTSRVRIASNLITSAAFTTNATPLNGLQTVAVDFKVAGNGNSNTKETYHLTDSIVARNSSRCSNLSTNWSAGTSTCTVVNVP